MSRIAVVALLLLATPLHTADRVHDPHESREADLRVVVDAQARVVLDGPVVGAAAVINRGDTHDELPKAGVSGGQGAPL